MTTSTDLKTFKIAKGTKAQIVTAYNNGDIGDTDFAIATDEVYAAMPDYSAGVSKSWNTSIQADKDGWVFVDGATTASGDGSFKLSVSPNGSNWTKISNFYAATAYGSGSCVVPISKGYYYKAEQGAGGHTLTFYPCRGA